LFTDYRQLTVFIRLDYIVLHWFLPTPCPKLPWGAFTSQTPSNSSWRGRCTPATSSCAPTPALPTCPNHVKNNQVCMQGERTFKSGGKINLMGVKFMSFIVGVGPASIMVGNLVAGKRIAQAAGRDLGLIEDQDLVRKVNSDFPLYRETV